jgi:hypothetical protein
LTTCHHFSTISTIPVVSIISSYHLLLHHSFLSYFIIPFYPLTFPSFPHRADAHREAMEAASAAGALTAMVHNMVAEGGGDGGTLSEGPSEEEDEGGSGSEFEAQLAAGAMGSDAAVRLDALARFKSFKQVRVYVCIGVFKCVCVHACVRVCVCGPCPGKCMGKSEMHIDKELLCLGNAELGAVA